ncbi:hypothetical protein Hanom_Chr09g00866071 [Helianthus anomalus]
MANFDTDIPLEYHCANRDTSGTARSYPSPLGYIICLHRFRRKTQLFGNF